MLLAFAEKNPGMARVLTGDALVDEHERLQARINQFYDRFEATLKQALRVAGAEGQKRPTPRSAAHAGDARALRARPPAPVREERLREEADGGLRRRGVLTLKSGRQT